MTAAELPLAAPRVRALPRTCILFALSLERNALKLAGTPDIRIAETGPGAENAARATSGVLGAYEDTPPTLIVCGFGGALTPAMKPGDLIIADSIVDATEGLDYPRERLIPDLELVSAAMEQRVAGSRLMKGTLVTANRVLITAHEKREWTRRTGAIAVDMESAAAAAAANGRGARWLAVRAITDDSETDLPLDFNALTGPDGNIIAWKATLATVIRPWTIPGLLRLGKHSTLAGRNLAQFLEMFVRRLPLSDDTTVSRE